MKSIEYSILSRGTEKESNSRGYMSITKKGFFYKYIIPENHGTIFAKINKKNSLKFDKNENIKKIAIYRFMLMTSLAFLKININNKKTNVLIIGTGSLAISSYLYLKKMKFSNIFLKTKRENISFSFIPKKKY